MIGGTFFTVTVSIAVILIYFMFQSKSVKKAIPFLIVLSIGVICISKLYNNLYTQDTENYIPNIEETKQ